MRKYSLITFLFIILEANAQKDDFSFNAGISFGSVKFTKDEIIKDVVSISNMSWNPNGEIYSMGFGHRVSNINCMNLMAHITLNANLFKKNKISSGVNIRAGVGYLFTTSISAYNGNTFEKSSTSDIEKIDELSLSGSCSAFFRYDFRLSEYNVYFKFNSGICLLRAHDDFLMPQFGIEVGNEIIGIGLDGNFTSLNYYRELSNGDTEIAQKSSCIGSIRLHYNINR